MGIKNHTIKPAWDTYHTEGIKTEYLFRFMKQERMFELLKTGQMSMTRLDLFEDRFEGIETSNIFYKEYSQFLKSDFPWNPDLPEGAKEDMKSIAKSKFIELKDKLLKVQRQNYACCWFMSNRESVAMWDLYGKNGLAIRIDRVKFQNKVAERLDKNVFPTDAKYIVAGKIVYHDFQNVPKEEDKYSVKYLSFRKDESFEHEKEYRVVLHTDNYHPTLERFNYSLGDLSELDIKVIASPRMSAEKFAETKEMLRQINAKIDLHESELTLWFNL